MEIVNLYPDQLQAKRDFYEAIRRGFQAPIIVANTGFGKTHVAASVVKDVAGKGKRSLFVADREELVDQAAARLQEFGVDCGIIMGDRRAALDRQVQVASIDTLARRDLSLLGDFALIVPDECHLTCSNRYRRLFAHYPRSIRMGLSGTPERLDGQGLGIHKGGHFDCLISTPSKSELVAMGRLPPSQYFAPDEVDTAGLPTEYGDYAQRQAAERVDRPDLVGSIANHYAKLGRGRPAMFFAANIAHAEHIAAELRAHGFQAVAVSGKSPRDLRRQAPQDLASGQLHAIVNVALWVQGFDCPPVSYIGLCALTQSRTKFYQEAGRADRIHWSKVDSIIADHANCWAGLGLPGSPYPWSLDGRRKKTREDEDAFAVHRCPKCYAVLERSSRKCGCGHAFADLVKARKIVVGDGELRKIEQDAEDEAAKLRRMQQGMARDRAALIAMGMNPARADHVIAGRAEKQELRRELAAERRARGLPLKGIDELKPKALRAEIASLRGEVAA